MSKKLFVSLLFIAWSVALFSQNSLTNAWDSFKNNKIQKARQAFTEAAKNPEFAQEAYLGLCLTNSIDRQSTDIHDPFSKFLTLVDDPNPYLHALWYDEAISQTTMVVDKDRIKFVKSLIENPKINATIKAYANFYLGDKSESLNDFSKANEYYSKIGALMNWQILGNFENISESGYDKDFGALSHPESSYEFKNKNNQTIKWLTLPKYAPGQWIRFGSHLNSDNSIFYAQTFAYSPSKREVQFRLGVSGSVKVWVNDKLLFQEREERNNGIDAYIFSVGLESGVNRILIQIGESEVENSNFLLRITDEKGNVQSDILASSEFKEYAQSYSYESRITPPFAEVYFSKLFNNEPTNILAGIFLAKAYLMSDKTYEARKIIVQNQKNAPKMSYLINQKMEVYIREKAQTLLSQELEGLRLSDPQNPLSLSMEFDEMKENKDFEKAKEYLDSYEAITGKTPTVYLNRIELLLAEEKTSDAVDLVLEAYEKYPYIGGIMNYRLQVAEYVDKNIPLAISLLKKFMKTSWTTGNAQLLSDYYMKFGNSASAYSEMEKIIKNYPYLPIHKFNLAELYAESQNYQKAISLYRAGIAEAPYTGFYHSALANAYKEIENDAEAQKEFNMGIQYDPQDYDARRSLRKLEGKKMIFSYFDEPNLYKIFENAPKAEDYPEDNSVIMVEQINRIVYEGGGSEEKKFLLVKVFNASGVDDWKDYQVYADNIEKAEVLKKDGSRLKAEINNGRVVFTNLSEGDGILLIYTYEYQQGGKMLPHFWGNHNLQSYYPYQLNKYCLIVEGNKQFEHQVTVSNLKPEVSKVENNFTLYTWQVNDIAGFKSEDYVASYYDVLPILQYSSIPDWNFIREWYYGIYRTKTKADYEVKDAIAIIFEGKENLSQLEKARLIYEYIVKNIRYSSISFRQSGIVPQKAKTTLNTKIGDCKDVSTLFIALCQEAGIKAEMVLVNTRNNGAREMVYPGFEFNHAIAKAIIDGKEYYVELTSDLNPFCTMGRNLKSSFALEIVESNKNVAPKFIDTKYRVKNAAVRKSIVSFEGDKMIIKRNNILYGDWAAMARNTYRDMGKSKREKELVKEVGAEFPKMKIAESNFDTTLYLMTDSVIYSYTIEASDVFISYKGDELFKIPFSNKFSKVDFINDPDRTYDFCLWKYNNDDFENQIVELIIPANKDIVEIPKDYAISCPYGEYKVSYKRMANTIYITRTMVWLKDEVPSAEFKTFADFLSKAIKYDNETQLSFKKK